MAHKTNSFERFWKELKRRKVVHVITVYAAVAFVILQLVDMVAEPLRLPDSTKALVIVLLCTGFVIAVFVSWVYDITPAGVKKTKPVSELKHVDQATAPASNGWKIATYISGAIIVALVAFNLISRRNLNADISKLEKSIAVLPFLNESPVDSNKYFINGIMEEVLTNLQKIKEFRVLSRTSTDQYIGQGRPTIPEIAKKLEVSYIVEGSGQMYGNVFILRVQLIKGKGKETHLWAKSFEKEIKEVEDYIKIQSQIAQAIAAELKAVITPEEKQLIEKVPTTNLTALAFYQRGREEEGKFPYYDITESSAFLAGLNPSTEQSFERAEKMYKTAVEYDSTFALAYTGLASIYWRKNYYREYLSETFLDSVHILVNKAISLDNQLPDAYFIRGMYNGTKGLYKQANEDFDKALKLNPNFWLAYYGKGTYSEDIDNLEALKNFKEAASRNHGSGLSLIFKKISFILSSAGFQEVAKKYISEAAKLESDSSVYYFWLWMHEFDFEKCISFYKKRYIIDSTDLTTLEFLSGYYEQTDQFIECLRFYKKWLDRLKEEGKERRNSMQRFGYAYSINGLKDSAEYYFNKQIEICNEEIRLKSPYGISGNAYYDLAGVYAYKGNKAKAYENLRDFCQKPDFLLWIVRYIKYDPLFNSIRNESEFQNIMKDMDAKYQAEHERVRKWLEEQGML